MREREREFQSVFCTIERRALPAPLEVSGRGVDSIGSVAGELWNAVGGFRDSEGEAQECVVGLTAVAVLSTTARLRITRWMLP